MSDAQNKNNGFAKKGLNRRQLLTSTMSAAAIGVAAMPIAAQNKTASLAGKSILITGTSSGFGYLGALHYARNGAKVIATMRNLPRPEADELAKIAKTEMLDLHIVEIDVLSDESVDKGIAEAQKIAGGGLDVVINNAGIGMSGPIEVQDLESTKLIFDTNVFGVQRVTRAALPAMRVKKSGQIFNISSQLGRVMVPGFGQYSPSKFALEAMSEQMAYELVPHGIEVTVIQPGGYPTAIWKKRNAYDNALLARSDQERLDAYPALTARMGKAEGDGRSESDPMDIPNAIIDIIAMPAGSRPLRKEVHPGPKPQIAINNVSAKVQLGFLGESPYGPWIKAVHSS